MLRDAAEISSPALLEDDELFVKSFRFSSLFFFLFLFLTFSEQNFAGKVLSSVRTENKFEKRVGIWIFLFYFDDYESVIKCARERWKDVVWLPNFCFDDVWIESVCTRYDYWLLKGSMYFISTMLSGKCIQETMLLIIEGYKIKMKRK